MALLEIKNLTVSFDTSVGEFFAVRGIDLHVNEREVLAIVGESGSGKSVAMLAVMGLLPPTATVQGRLHDASRATTSSAWHREERRKIIGKDIAMIFQEPMASLNPCFTIGFQIEEMLQQHTDLDGAARRRARRRAADGGGHRRPCRAAWRPSRTRCRAGSASA